MGQKGHFSWFHRSVLHLALQGGLWVRWKPEALLLHREEAWSLTLFPCRPCFVKAAPAIPHLAPLGGWSDSSFRHAGPGKSPALSLPAAHPASQPKPPASPGLSCLPLPGGQWCSFTRAATLFCPPLPRFLSNQAKAPISEKGLELSQCSQAEHSCPFPGCSGHGLWAWCLSPPTVALSFELLLPAQDDWMRSSSSQPDPSLCVPMGLPF